MSKLDVGEPRIDEAFQELVAAGRKEDADVAGALRVGTLGRVWKRPKRR